VAEKSREKTRRGIERGVAKKGAKKAQHRPMGANPTSQTGRPVDLEETLLTLPQARAYSTNLSQWENVRTLRIKDKKKLMCADLSQNGVSRDYDSHLLF